MTSEPQISERERTILRLVAMGATNQQIANQLHISVNTVKVHLRNIFEKIDVASRTEATVYAIRLGLVQLDGQPSQHGGTPGHTTLEAAPSSPEPTIETAVLDEERPIAPLVGEASLVRPAEAPEEAHPPHQRATSRRTLLLAVLAGVGVLLVAAVVYALLQRQLAPVAPPQAATTPAPTNRWKHHVVWPRARANFAVAAYDGKVYAIGGSAATGPSAAVDRFDPAQGQWVSLNDKPTPATHVQGVTIGGRIYIPGGEGKSGEILTVFEAYDPRSQQWESLPALPQARSRYALATFEGKLYLFGGWDGKNARKEVFEYDPANKRWTERAPLPTARSNAGAAIFQDHIYVIGGENEQGALRVNERFDPTGSGNSAWASVVPLTAAVATPAVVGTVDSVLVFDPQLRIAAQYSPAKDSWSPPLAIPADTAISSRALTLSTSIFLFGQPDLQDASAVSEYQVSYQTLFPLINTGQ
jgi:DNA-binding CsgD family transcriptional regulator